MKRYAWCSIKTGFLYLLTASGTTSAHCCVLHYGSIHWKLNQLHIWFIPQTFLPRLAKHITLVNLSNANIFSSITNNIRRCFCENWAKQFPESLLWFIMPFVAANKWTLPNPMTCTQNVKNCCLSCKNLLFFIFLFSLNNENWSSAFIPEIYHLFPT